MKRWRREEEDDDEEEEEEEEEEVAIRDKSGHKIAWKNQHRQPYLD